MLPLAALVYLLFAGYTPIFAGTMGLALTVVLILGTPLAALIGPLAFRVVFWIALGLAAAAFMQFGVNVPRRWSSAALVARLPRCSRAAARRCVICVDSLAEGAKNALPVGIACAIVGIVIGTLTLTGIASTFIGAIIAIGEDNLFLSLVLTMLTCLVLGMGIPTIPNYIITSSLAGPALLELGVPLLVSHMFVFYFGIMADLTPPVALAAFAAAPMAKVSGHEDRRRGDQARHRRLRRAVHGRLHAGADAAGCRPDRRRLRLSGRGRLHRLQGLPRHRLWGAAVVGFLRGRAGLLGAHRRLRRRRPAWCWRCRCTDEIGFGLAVLLVGQHWWRARRAARVGAA